MIGHVTIELTVHTDLPKRKLGTLDTPLLNREQTEGFLSATVVKHAMELDAKTENRTKNRKQT